ncbi:hypothetical protein PHLCEN_2v7374 [Hermanssonia centrifuga]|uniref:isoleucine--tRNA ligase n=1 Tax=Hermanssonia centrifuga TaxID=98765 RepID=A0A2R6NXG8_9APHY|nr:hypothetical protein PHLCEN_2v7374 [Hermanssonia centrifuga]
MVRHMPMAICIWKDLSEADSVTIRKEAEKYAKEQIQSQMAQFKQFGIMSSWTTDTTYRTLDHDYEIRQLRIFQKMVERGLIYRHHRPVYYSPSSRSALAEAELEYKDSHVSHSTYVSYDLDLIRRDDWSPALGELIRQQPRAQLLVWTTTPWTFTANMAIAVNPDMRYIVMIDQKKPELGAVIFATERRPALRSILEEMQWDTVLGEIQGSDLAHASYRPLFSKLVDAPSLPVIPSSHVTPSSGTGLVHCAPAHGQEDYAVFRALGLMPASSASSIVCHVDSLGKFKPTVAEVLGNGFRELVEGKDVLGEGGKAMVSVLREIGVLRKIERIKHRYPYDWKTDQPVITMATSQWFANLDAIKDDAIAALQDVQFEPPQSRNRLETYVRSRSEWCISRQRVWGVPIPALYHLPTKRAVLDYASLSHILSILEKKGVRHWWDGSVEEFVPPYLRIDGENVNEAWMKGTDTMDVWFDSGTSWSMLEGLAKDDEVADRREGQYADVCLEGSDQHRGWFQSQLLTAVGCAQPERTQVSPYGTLITHGMVLDEKGKKMSKSLGNIVSPMTIINGGDNLKQDPVYGTEVLRLWAATVESGNDMSIGPKILSQCMESVRKIRNSARFILGNLGDKRQPQQEKVTHEHFSLADRYVMHKLYELESTSLEGYAKYDFARVVSSLSNFANITLSSLYFHITKDCLYADAPNSIGRRAVVTVMDQILETMTSVMAPILPHVAEEIHQTLHADNAHVSSVFCEPWKPLVVEKIW